MLQSEQDRREKREEKTKNKKSVTSTFYSTLSFQSALYPRRVSLSASLRHRVPSHEAIRERQARETRAALAASLTQRNFASTRRRPSTPRADTSPSSSPSFPIIATALVLAPDSAILPRAAVLEVARIEDEAELPSAFLGGGARVSARGVCSDGAGEKGWALRKSPAAQEPPAVSAMPLPTVRASGFAGSRRTYWQLNGSRFVLESSAIHKMLPEAP